MCKTAFFVLIIYGVLSTVSNSQNLELNVIGENENEDKILDSLGYVKFHSDYNAIRNEIDSLRNQLYRKGYLENKLSTFKKSNDSTFFAEIHLKRRFSSIRIFYNDDLVLDAAILKSLSNRVEAGYFETNFEKLENVLQRLNNNMSEKGFPFSKIKLSDIQINGAHLEAHLVVEGNQNKRHINDIIIKGYEKFPRSFLKHFLKIKKQSIFNLPQLKGKMENLKNLKFANQIKPPEILFSKDSTVLYLYIDKRPSNNFDGFLGFGTNEDSGNLEFDGYLNLNLTNNLNYGETFRLLYKSDENNQKTFEANLALPYLFNSPIGLDVKLNIFKRDSSFTNANQSVKLFYQINTRNKLYSGLTSTKSNNLLSNVGGSNISDFESTFFNIGYERLTLDSYNLLFPIQSSTQIDLNFGKREAGNAPDNQSLISFEWSKIFNFSERSSFYTRINSSALISDNYFDNELARFGGINSVRGFEENSLYASLFGFLNVEYRYLLSPSIFLNSITDIAYYENSSLNTKEKLFGFGFGLGTLTKAGLFRLIYANGKAENQGFKFSNSKVHLSLTSQF